MTEQIICEISENKENIFMLTSWLFSEVTWALTN